MQRLKKDRDFEIIVNGKMQQLLYIAHANLSSIDCKVNNCPSRNVESNLHRHIHMHVSWTYVSSGGTATTERERRHEQLSGQWGI